MGEPYSTGFPDLDEEIFKLRAELAQVKKERDKATAAERERIAKFIDSLPGFAIHRHLADVARRIRANELE